MPRTLEVQSTFSSGEVDPRLAERRDVQFYYSAATRMRNCIALPQGGFANSPGLASESPLRNPLSSVSLAGAVFTAPNGGTANNAKDGNLNTVLTTGSPSGANYVLLHIDMTTPTEFVAVDVIEFRCDTAPRDQVLQVQWSTNNSVWNTIATMDLDVFRRSRRFAVPPGQFIFARYIRIVANNAGGAGAVTIADVAIQEEQNFSGVVRTLNFNFARGQEYTHVITPRNGDVFHNGVWQASYALSVGAAQLPDLDWSFKLDSLLLFHEDLLTPLIKRQGRHTEWNFTAYPYLNLPRYDFGDVYANGVNAKQRIQLLNLVAGDNFDLSINGETTTSINVDASGANTANNIEVALEALTTIAAGLTVNHVGNNVAFDVIFTGSTNEAKEWPLMQGTAFDADGIVITRELIRGKAAGEPILSSNVGWPRTGVFYQQSLITAGARSLPLHLLKSITGAPTDFNTDLSDPAGAMFFELDAGTANEIFKLYNGFRLMAFTADGVFFLDADTLSQSETPKFPATQQPGMKRGVPIVTIEGRIIYVENAGNIIREMAFDQLLSNFSADNISALSSHMVNDPVDMAHRRALQTSENDLIHIVNTDGTLLFMTSLRSENVAGFTLRHTGLPGNGLFKSVAIDSEQAARVAVARRTAGTWRLWLERFDSSFVTDAAHVVTGSNITSIGVGEAFNGETLHVFCDKAYVGTRTVAGGEIAGLPASARIEAGYACLADVIDMLVLKDEEAQRPLARLKRCYEVALSLFETEHVALEVNGGAPYEVPLMELGQTEIGQSIGDVPFTGTVHLQGFPGFTEPGTVRVRQLRPGKLSVRQIRKSLRV